MILTLSVGCTGTNECGSFLESMLMPNVIIHLKFQVEGNANVNTTTNRLCDFEDI